MNRLFSLNLTRSLIRCAGAKNEASTFLQGMMTNDMRQFENGLNCIYTLFLNKLGRILYDSIIYKTQSSDDKEIFLIECDNEIVNNLVKHLKLYRVRRKIDITVSDEHDLWCYSGESSTSNLNMSNEAIVYEDPRLKNIGQRIIANKNYQFNNVEEGSNDEYLVHRYKLGVCEGIIEIPPEKSFPFEANADYMNGVNFHKGCYIGQELTARTHHTGVVRKRIMPLTFEKSLSINPAEAIDIKNEEKLNVGKLRKVVQNHGIGLLRIEQVLAAKELFCNENKCTTEKPFWWPSIETKA